LLIRATFILVFTACTGLACAGDDDPSSIAPAFSASELSQPPTDGWLTNGGDLFNRRFSPLTEINQDNVSTLRPVWRTHLNGSGVGPQFSGEAQPIIYGNVMYVVTGANDVFALSVDTGEVLWTYEANLDTAINTICCGWPGMKATITGDGWMGITPAGQKIYMTSLDIWNQVGVDVLARMKDLSIARQPYSLKN
jgi:glucose dehydrogenase